MFRDESEYSVSESADDNVMEGGVTIRMLSNYKNPVSSLSLHISTSMRHKSEFDFSFWLYLIAFAIGL